MKVLHSCDPCDHVFMWEDTESTFLSKDIVTTAFPQGNGKIQVEAYSNGFLNNHPQNRLV